MRRLAWGLAVLMLGACGSPATPTVNVAATQTRGAEVAQLATFSAPTATAPPSPTIPSSPTNPPAFLGPTWTALPPTATGPTKTAIPPREDPTATPIPPTATAVPPNPTPAAAAAVAPVVPSPTSPPAVAGIGDPVATKNWQMTVKGVERAKQLDFGYGKEAPLGVFLVVQVEMKNIGKQNFGVNTWDFVVKMPGDVTIKTTDQFGASGYGKDRGAAGVGGQVPPGVTVKYFFVYDVAPDATGLQLQFAQDNKPTVELGP